MRAKGHWNPWLRSVAGVVVVVAFALGGVAASYDSASHKHTTCAEHGEATHTASASQEASAADQVRPQARRRPAHAHDHCALSTALRKSLRAEDSSSFANGLTPECRPLAPRRTAAPAPTEPLYRLAPKTSPPALS